MLDVAIFHFDIAIGCIVYGIRIVQIEAFQAWLVSEQIYRVTLKYFSKECAR